MYGTRTVPTLRNSGYPKNEYLQSVQIWLSENTVDMVPVPTLLPSLLEIFMPPRLGFVACLGKKLLQSKTNNFIH